MWKPKRIKDLRDKFDETQAEFAKRLGISLGTLRDYEQGNREVFLPVALLLQVYEEDWIAGRKRELVPA